MKTGFYFSFGKGDISVGLENVPEEAVIAAATVLGGADFAENMVQLLKEMANVEGKRDLLQHPR